MPAAIGNFHSTIQTKWHVDIDLPCITSGAPTPNVKWTFNGQPIDLQRSVIYENFTLHLESVTNMETGNYTCTAWNVYGSENVTTSLLVVGKYSNYVQCSREKRRKPIFQDVFSRKNPPDVWFYNLPPSFKLVFTT